MPEEKVMVVPGRGGEPPVVVVRPQGTRRRTQKAFRAAAQVAARMKAERVGLSLAGVDAAMVRAALWGVGQGLYRYQTPGKTVLGPLVTVESEQDLALEFAILKQQSAVRDWINYPSNLKPPAQLADMMQAKSPESIQWTVYDHRALADMGAGGILAVGQGSHRPPVMLTGRYEGDPGKPWIALVGKGIVFDSGGISLKPGDGMGRMKGDMGGAAAAAGAIRAIADLGMKANVLAVLPLAENLPGGGAYRPGDILTMMDGTEVEIISTDAEGRLVLADAVTWAVRENVSAIIDMATLTGANVVALGGIRSGLLSNDDVLARLVRDASETMAEPCWELPHDEDYVDLIQSTAADIKNSGGRPAGTVTAGLFIGHFAKNTPWAHLDIAGLSFEGDGPGGIGAGATGYGVAALVESTARFAR
jgi:leucyl aminopeptidase